MFICQLKPGGETAGQVMTAILVIEDDLPVRTTILDVLKAEEFEVYGARNGIEGVHIAREYMPDLIISDVMMPGLDGYGVVRELRQDPNTATIPIILLTAKVERNEMRQGMEYGADDYIPKPFSIPELMNAVSAQIRKRTAIVHKYESTLRLLRKNITYALPHELKTPLTGILGYAHILLMDYEKIQPESIQEYANWIVKSGERLQRLIENYLVYAQLEIVSSDPKQVAALRNHIIKNTDDIIREETTRIAEEMNRQGDLHLDLCNVALQISAQDLRKVVSELVQNAFKFSPAGTKVKVSACRNAGTFDLIIHDNGRGMTAEQIHQMGAYMQFERKLYEQQGIGLGFSIAKSLIQLHGGQINITSTPGVETTVHLSFPI
jgi:signal transduction histidine kinase